jgi:predicted acetylornithine/succinylornithine family transaminase
MSDRTSLIRRGEAAILPTYPERPLALVRGAGCTVWDEDGNAYLDLVGGLAVCSLGHGHPAPAAALAEQAARLGHVSNLFWTEPAIALAERLHELAGFGRAFFCNSGAEANEAAIKLARRRGGVRGGPGKNEIVCLDRAFHGRTLATLAAGSSAAKRDPFGPVAHGFLHVPVNDVDALRAAVTAHTAAVLVEPVQGEGGVWPLTRAYLEEARALCDRHDALLIYDEVQTGIGRLGEWFGFQLLGVRPDAITLAKGLGGGLPIGVLLADEVGDGFQRGDHASTFGGSPPIAAAALAVLTAIEREGLVENAQTVGATLAARAATIEGVASVRGAGLLLAVELASVPSADAAAALRERGILVNAITPTALRLVPPLCISQGEADRFCDALADVLGRDRELTRH